MCVLEAFENGVIIFDFLPMGFVTKTRPFISKVGVGAVGISTVQVVYRTVHYTPQLDNTKLRNQRINFVPLRSNPKWPKGYF